MGRFVVVLFGPPGAGKTSIAEESGLRFFDRDQPEWRERGESGFNRALKALGEEPGAEAVVIRSGASSSARTKTIRDTHATHAYLVLTPEAECRRRVVRRGRGDAKQSQAALTRWWARFDHDDLVPEWPGGWEDVLGSAPFLTPLPRVSRAPKLPPAMRGYDAAHRQMRKALEPFVRSGQAVCPRCAKSILPGQAWDLGHSDDRARWTGAEHASCNRSAGALNAARVRNERRTGRADPPPPPGW